MVKRDIKTLIVILVFSIINRLNACDTSTSSGLFLDNKANHSGC